MRRQVEENDGSLLIRLPGKLKKRLEAMAEEKRVSVSQVVRVAIVTILDLKYGVECRDEG